ncbi:hypothetical protein T492DRAFT_837918 [Pavlovales sp. CCMP2436]|nr:hypothetical protein T492DRAFT_837918 [Pavlovales sp. CCMP2436]
MRLAGLLLAHAASALLLFVLLAGVQLAGVQLLGTVELVDLVCARLRDAGGLTGWLADGRRVLEGEQCVQTFERRIMRRFDEASADGGEFLSDFTRNDFDLVWVLRARYFRAEYLW